MFVADTVKDTRAFPKTHKPYFYYFTNFANISWSCLERVYGNYVWCAFLGEGRKRLSSKNVCPLVLFYILADVFDTPSPKSKSS
jgi:hypothetical protein